MSERMKSVLCCFMVLFSVCFILIHPALADDSAAEKIPLNPYGIRSSNPYVVKRFVVNGQTIDQVIVPAMPSRPKGVMPQVAMAPEPDIAAGTNTIPNVPAMTWCFGCGATSAAMMFGHYDNSGYPNMYTGPTNGGVFPMTNEVWGTVEINGETRAQCPLSATRLGLDGRTIKGHVDDYWVRMEDPGPDPFIGNWPEHTHGDCTGDFMGTSQSNKSNSDGWSSYYYNWDGSPLVDFTDVEPGNRDLCHGLRLFVESRGYSVATNFNQLIYGYDGNTNGFTFEDFKAEIDAGRPVIIYVTGHIMLGYGYEDTGSTIYIRDTWDYSTHSMTWGGSYSGMQHLGVCVVRLASNSLPAAPTLAVSTDGIKVTVSWTAVANALGYVL